MKDRFFIGILTSLLIVIVFPATLGQEDNTTQVGNITHYVSLNDTTTATNPDPSITPDTSRYAINQNVIQVQDSSIILAIMGIIATGALTIIGFLIGRHFQKKDSKFIVREMVKNMIEALNAYHRLSKVDDGKLALREGKDPKIGGDLVKVVNEFVKTFSMDALIGSKEQRLEEKKRLEKEIQELGEGEGKKKTELQEKIRKLALDEDEKS